MAQNKWLWVHSFVGLVGEGREMKPRLQRLSEERGEWLLFEMEEVVWEVIENIDVVDNEG